MNPFLFRILFIGLFLLKLLIKSGLDLINQIHLRRNTGKIPAELNSLVDFSKVKEIQSYNIAKMNFRWVYFLFNNFLLFIFLFSPLYAWYTDWIGSFHTPFMVQGILFFWVLSLITWLLDLPFNYLFNFRLEAAFGFNKYNLRSWFMDETKNFFVSSVLIFIISGFIFGIWSDPFTFRWRDVFFGWSVSFLLIVILMYLIPVLLIPFFYKLNPIENEELSAKIINLVKESGFKVRGIFVADESSKSAHANAMFSGIGSNKTIILFDTLLNKYSTDEILAILAHEIGHGKKRHVIKLMFITIVELFLFILFASFLLATNLIYQAFGISTVLYSGGFLTYILFFDLLAFFIQPLYSSLSRTYEYQADRYAKQLVGTGAPLISSFHKLITNELDNLNPHPYYEAFYYSHPTLLKRIKALD